MVCSRNAACEVHLPVHVCRNVAYRVSVSGVRNMQSVLPAATSSHTCKNDSGSRARSSAMAAHKKEIFQEMLLRFVKPLAPALAEALGPSLG